MSDLVQRAEAFSITAHTGQLRKYDGTPYHLHPKAVADLVRTVPHTPEMLAAAYLHDTVEDTPVTLEQIEAEFGREVRELVYWLSDISKPSDGNRAVRKQLDREHIARAPATAKTVKLADLIDNSRSIQERDPNFAKVYMREKQALLVEALTEGDPVLYGIAATIVAHYFNQEQTNA